ncbi:MAG TPA: bifunctional [glutamate--ammonia ligase]-adenylyl-L-tyrosine phosphorylase/[glutamate--ammonia-ligase] adenylyltransferase [Thiomicrorhabdus sp.]|nr:bifunctional [glutamate--ammonia ligase]-adenylyl-L-tyrosine phosphorylase/[glutamate--ammonia-ligase] adenylyltransferase [Thiomicrorhabdus sp.]
MSEQTISQPMYSLNQVQQWSPYVAQMCQRFPELLNSEHWSQAWVAGRLYQQVYETVVDSQDEENLKQNLRTLRNWQMTRIAIRDLSGLATLDETMRDLSDLADALVASTLDWHYERFCPKYGVPIGRDSGLPQKMLVIGMGKLGGQELNFSSDIDLIFVYPEGGETKIQTGQARRRPISNDQFFVRLGQAVNKSLVEMTADGFVYRVDMRLRPFGDGGSLAVSFSGMEHYYEIHGRAWERYALVKGRVIAGDAEEAAYLFDILRPFVYRRYVDFTAMDSLRELKQMIAAQVKKKGMEDNIKLGRGGIREIEFIAQAFQLIHGGRDKALQTRTLLTTLERLRQRNFLEESAYQTLTAAYVFLRRAENRLQAWRDQQVHDLPSDEAQQLSLAQSMGYENYAQFLADLNTHREGVQTQFDQVFAEDDRCEEADALADLWLEGVEVSDDLTLIMSYGLTEAQAKNFLQPLVAFQKGRIVQTLEKEGVARLNLVMPLLLREILSADYSAECLERVLSVMESIAKRSVYLVLLKENVAALQRLIELCHVSAWLADMLVKYPALLDQLLDKEALFSPLDAKALHQESQFILNSAQRDEEEFMNSLRQWRHAQVFKVAAADVTGNVPVTEVSNYLTWIAEAVLACVVEFAWQLMQQKNGLPGGMSQANKRNPFMVLGYGKLGGIELGYGSDLDVVFVYQGLKSSEQAVSSTGKTLDNSMYFVRMGQKIISLMTTMMPAGILYEVDTRLRPNGASGMMVVDFESYQSYLQNKAWVWEHQAFVRVRAVTGDRQSLAAFNQFKTSFLQQERDVAVIRKEVVDMRQKMMDELDKSSDSVFDLKQGRGGIVDIEFMMQFLVLSYAHSYPELCRYSDNLRILEAVSSVGLLSSEESKSLLDAYKVYRSKYHRVALQNEKPLVSHDCYLPQRKAVQTVWQKLMLEK